MWLNRLEYFGWIAKSGSWAGLGRTLRISWATTVPLELLFAHVFCALYSRSFFCSPNVYTNSMRVFLSETTLSFVQTHLHIEGPCACLCFWPGDMDKGSTLDLKLARSLREVCADFGWKIIFLAGLLLILRGLEHRTCMRLTVRETKIRCRIATQAYKSMLKKQYDIPLYNFPCAKPWAARDLRDAGFKLSRSSQQTRLLNFKTVLEQPPHGLSYQN